jgi:alcohol dehydrogenase class IV
MEELIEFYLPYSVQLGKAFGVAVGEPEATVRAVIALIKKLQKDTGMPENFAEFKIPATDMERIIMAIASDPLAIMYQIPPQKIAAIVTRVMG